MSDESATKTAVAEGGAVSGGSQNTGSGCCLCRCLNWFAGMWRVLLAYLIGVGLLALLMTIMRRMQE